MLLALDLDDAHPTGTEARQLGLVAEGRDLDPVVAADLEDRLAREALDHPTIDLDADRGRRLRPLWGLRREQPLGVRVLERRDRADLDRAVGAALRAPVQAARNVAVLLPAERIRLRRRERLRRLGWRGRRHVARRALDEIGHAEAPTATRIGRQTPAGHSPRSRCASSSSRKYRSPLSIGSVAS